MKLLILALMFPSYGFAQSIVNLPQLSRLLVHHYDCRVAHIPPEGLGKELLFQISPQSSGHSGTDFTLVDGADKVVASANAQMMSVVWTRGSQVVANAQSWVQNSSTQAFVMIIGDPKNETNQVHMNCNAVTFDQVKK